MPTTELFEMPLVANSDIGDPSNNAAAVAKESFTTLSQQNGIRSIFFGMQKEKPDVFHAMIGWDTLQHHKEFMATSSYSPFTEKLLSLNAGKPQITHVDFEPSEDAFISGLRAPITELATFVFASDAHATQFAKYADNVRTFEAAIEKASVPGFKSAAFGITAEDVSLANSSGQTVTGKGAVLVIGWESIESHLAFRETQVFKDNIHLLREGIQAAEMRHVKFLPFVRD